jgi:hypothetical protein
MHWENKVYDVSPDLLVLYIYIQVYIYIVNLPNPSSITMALVSTQALTEIITRNIPGGGRKARLARQTDNRAAICESIIKKLFEPRRLKTQ